jgi:hypothetical protein
MADRVDLEIHVEVGPEEVVCRRTLDVQDLPDRRLAKRRARPELDEQLLAVEQQPEAVRGNVRDLNGESASPRCADLNLVLPNQPIAVRKEGWLRPGFLARAIQQWGPDRSPDDMSDVT